MPRTVYIARHGHREDLLGDQSNNTWRQTAERPHDPGLSPEGHRQAREVADRVRGLGIAHLFASPFLRTVQTAQPIAEALNLPICIEHGLCEWLNPRWFSQAPDLLPPDQLRRDYPRIDPAYVSRLTPTYPEPDERADAWPRVARTLQRLLADFPGDLMLISHGASCAGAIHALCGRLPEGLQMRMCSLTRIEQDAGGWTCTLAACTRHLSTSEQQVRFH